MPLTGAVGAMAATSGGLGRQVEIAGLIVAASIMAGAPSETAALLAVSVGTMSINATARVVHSLAATSVSSSATQGIFTLMMPLTGAVGAACGVGAAASAVISLAALGAGAGDMSGVLSCAIPLTGESAGGTAVVGAMGRTLPLAGLAAGQGTASGTLCVPLVLAALAAAGSAAWGDIWRHRPIAGAIAGDSGTGAGLSSAPGLVARATTESDLNGNVGMAYALTGMAAAEVDATVFLGILRQLAGTNRGAATVLAALIMIPYMLNPLTAEVDASASTIEAAASIGVIVDEDSSEVRLDTTGSQVGL